MAATRDPDGSAARAATAAVAAHVARMEPGGLRVPLGFDVPRVAAVGGGIDAALSAVAASGRWRLRTAGSDYAVERVDPTWYDVALHAHRDAALRCEDGGSMLITVVTGCRPTGGAATAGARELRVETRSYEP